MTTTNIARNIALLRKERKINQEQLADYLGVTKASVSKWETGQSYPDFTTLPRIATYFGVTIDELVGYEPQLTTERIQAECEKLRQVFATQGFDAAHGACQELIRDYYSCYPLLTQMAALYVNYLGLAPTPEAGQALTAETLELCQRVRTGSTIPADIKLANTLESSLLLMQGKAAEVVQLMEGTITPETGESLILATALKMTGDPQKAESVRQAALMQSLVMSANVLAAMAMERTAEPAYLKKAHSRALALIETFDLENVYLNSAGCHLQFAQAFALAGETDAAFVCLNDYVRACRRMEFPLRLHGDAFFDHLDEWAASLPSGTAAPRDDQTVKASLLAGVKDNPILAALATDPRFGCILTNLEEIAR